MDFVVVVSSYFDWSALFPLNCMFMKFVVMIHWVCAAKNGNAGGEGAVRGLHYDVRCMGSTIV